jgi:WD40 repeat protein
MLWEKVGNSGGGEALAFSNDGRLLLAPTAKTGPEDEHTTLTLWDVATGTIAGRVAGPYPDQGLAWNYARRMALDREHGLMAVIAASDSGTPVDIYDTHGWLPKGPVAVESERPKVLAFGPDSALAIGMVGSKIALIDAHTRTIKRILDAHGFIYSLAYSPDGKYVASGTAGVLDPIRIWSTADGTLVRSYAGGDAEVVGLSWSPDGRYLASASYDRTIRLWPATTDGAGEIVAILDRGASCVAFSPDGTLIAAGSSEDDAIVAALK